MSSYVGRPTATYQTQRAGQLPYPPPGVVRPAQPRGNSSNHPQHRSQRAIARERWARLLSGPAFLEPGPSNRLVLSLRSCVPADVDFAIERLIQISSIDPDLLRFTELPGLLDGLLALIRDYLDRRIQDRQGGAQSLTAVMYSEARDLYRRRASEAALILRNLALEKRSMDTLVESKRLRKMIVQVLEEGEIEGPEGEETTEVRLYLLEVLEIIGENVPLALPGYALMSSPDADENAPPPKPEPLDAPSVRLFPLLVALTRSPDRALILSAFRCLTVLSLNDKSDSVFAILAYDALPPLPKPHPHPIQTAIELLPLADSELNAVVLDFMYQHILLPSNAAYFSTRPELLAILRLVCSKFHSGAREEQVETDILQTNSDGSNWFKKNRQVPLVDGGGKKRFVTSPTGEIVLSNQEMKDILPIQEPDRAIAWMQLMYEIDPSSDITQVSLWMTYKAQFEPQMNATVPPMLAAQDVIKHSSTAHPSAVPTIVEEGDQRKFIIKGLKARGRPNGPGDCCWEGCPVPSGHDSAVAFHHHVYNTHLALPEPPTSCEWTDCRYASPHLDPALRLADLSIHTRIHLPPVPSYPSTLQQSSLSSSLTPLSSPSTDSTTPSTKLYHTRYHAHLDDHSEPTGPGFLACLVLRNLVRAAKFARQAVAGDSTPSSTESSQRESQPGGSGDKGGRVTVASGNAAIGRLAEGEQSIFEAFAQAEEGSMKKGGGILSQIEKVDWSIAVPVIDALCSVQTTINKTTLSDAALGKYLAEVVATIEELRRSTNRGGGKEKASSKTVQMDTNP